VRRFSNGVEFANAGDAFVFLWSHDGRSSIAWDCLPGVIPECRITDYTVYIVFPLWILLIPIGSLTALLFWRDRKRIDPGYC